MAAKKKSLQKTPKDSRQVHGAAKKGDVFRIDPEKLTFVTDPTAPGYNPGVLVEPTEAFVRNVDYYGVLTPIRVCRNTETGQTEVIYGVKRTKALRIANKRRIERGQEPHLMPMIVQRSVHGAEAAGMIITENEQRQATTASNRAEMAARMMDHGASHEDVGIAMGMDAAQVKNLLAFGEAPAFVRKAVDGEQITLTNGIKAAKLAIKDGPEAGRKLVEKLIAEAPRTPGKKRSPNSRKAREIVDGAPVMRSKKEIVQMKASLISGQITFGGPSEERARVIVEVLAWVLGEGVLTGIDEPARPLAVASAG